MALYHKASLLAIVTVFVVIAITFFAMHAIQGGPFDNEKASDPAVIQAPTEWYDLDKPLGEEFFYLSRSAVRRRSRHLHAQRSRDFANDQQSLYWPKSADIRFWCRCSSVFCSA